MTPPPPSAFPNLHRCKMALVALKRKSLKSLTGLPECSMVQRFSSSSTDAPPKQCYLMGVSGLVRIPGCKYQALQDFFSKQPFLVTVPTNRLIGITNRPFCLMDDLRQLLQSGSITAFMANKFGVSIENPFLKDNVGIHTDIGLLVFRELRQAKVAKSADALYHEFADFVEQVVVEYHGQNSLSQLPQDLESFLADLRNPLVDEKSIMEHPTLMSNNIYVGICIELHRIVFEEARAVGIPRTVTDRLLESIGIDHKGALTPCLQHGILPQFMPYKLQITHKNIWPIPQNIAASTVLTHVECGTLMVKLHRHSYVHPVGFEIVRLVRRNFPTFQGQPRRQDILPICRIHYPNYLRSALKAMVRAQLYSDLNISDHLKISDVYLASPSYIVQVIANMVVLVAIVNV